MFHLLCIKHGFRNIILEIDSPEILNLLTLDKGKYVDASNLVCDCRKMLEVILTVKIQPVRRAANKVAECPAEHAAYQDEILSVFMSPPDFVSSFCLNVL